MTSHPGYGRSPAVRMCIGHFSECENGVLHVHVFRLLSEIFQILLIRDND